MVLRKKGVTFQNFLRETNRDWQTGRQTDRERGEGGGSVPRKGAAPSEKEGSSNPGGNYDVIIFQWHLWVVIFSNFGILFF